MILCTGAAVEVARLNNFPLMVMAMKMISFKSNEIRNNWRKKKKNYLFIGQRREREEREDCIVT
jgi:hypothetical protein